MPNELGRSANHVTAGLNGGVPLRRTKPSTMGVTLTVLVPISMTSEVPFPAAKLANKKISNEGSPAGDGRGLTS